MTAEVCPDCGIEIPEDAPLGLCPACLIGGTEDDVELPISDADSIGDYSIIRKIGEGGFAIVYEAEQQEPVQRRVALKVLKPDMASPQVLARFDAERQALALMDHPSIAAIYDAGQTSDGDPFFAMEFVEGAPITEFCVRQLLGRDEKLR
ncbi:MAG: protein kinase, partial [Verrucomicrobiota bacterium]